SFDILCIGELVTDYITTEDRPLKEVTVFEKFFGGSPANIAFHIKSLGSHPLLITKIGDDEDGRFLLDVLAKHNIVNDHIKIAEKRGTTKVFHRRHVERPEFELLRGADAHLKHKEVDFRIIEKVKIVHTNAFTLAEEPVREVALAAIERAHELGKIVSFDPNYRFKVWPDKKTALETLKRVYRFVDLTKPSMDDARELFGNLTPREFIRKFHTLGAKTVVLTMGSKGSLISDGNNIISIPVEQCDAKEATGAGDLYWSVFLLSLLNGDGLETAGRKASFSATKAVTRSGAILDKDDYGEIKAYMGLF
ncbi:hypothetical protein KY349_00720, partial [Candidatus Woesearchaeota archaeon]|nr:hypothetical protein [Candidatus Woesearchaeota archaeon]